MLTLIDLAKIVLSSGVTATIFSTVAGYGRDWLKDRGETSRNRSYTTLRLAVHLERYAHECAAVSAENGDYVDTHGQIGRARATLPKFAPFPEVDWRVLRAPLASKAMSFENEMLIAHETVESAAAISDRPDYRHVADGSAMIGQTAWEIACELRKFGGLPSLSFNAPNWDYPKYLGRAGTQVRLQRAKWAEQMKANFPPTDETPNETDA